MIRATRSRVGCSADWDSGLHTGNDCGRANTVENGRTGERKKGNKKGNSREPTNQLRGSHDKPHCAAVDRKIGELEERGDSAGEGEGERKLGSWTKREEETEKDGGR